MARFEFNAADHDIPEFENVPPGWYAATITSSELVQSKSEAAGEMFQITFEIDANEHPEVGARKITTNFCINHESQKTALIARGQLAKILMVTNLQKTKDTSDLLGAQLQIRVKMGKARDGYDARSEYGDCKPLGAEPAQAPAKAAAKAAPAPSTAGNGNKAAGAKPAWK